MWPAFIIGGLGSTVPNSVGSSQRSEQHVKYQTPASALYEATESLRSSHASSQTTHRKNGTFLYSAYIPSCSFIKLGLPFYILHPWGVFTAIESSFCL